jgi:hypothetical protein
VKGEGGCVEFVRTKRGVRPAGRDSYRNSTLVRPVALHGRSAPACLQVKDFQTVKAQTQVKPPPVPEKSPLRVETTTIPSRRVTNTSRADSTARLVQSSSSRYTTTKMSPIARSITLPSPIHTRFPAHGLDLRGTRRSSTKLSRSSKFREEDMDVPMEDLTHDGSPVSPRRGV